MQVLFIINDAPYGTEKAYNTLRLAMAFQKTHKDASIRIFLLADSVGCALPNQKTPDGYYNIERMLKLVVQQGAEIKACGVCADARGMSELELLPGVQLSNMMELSDWISEADKVITF